MAMMDIVQSEEVFTLQPLTETSAAGSPKEILEDVKTSVTQENKI